MLHLWRAWSPPPGLSSEFETEENPEEEEITKKCCGCLHPNRQLAFTTSDIHESTRDYLRLGSSLLQRKSARMGSPGSHRDNTPGTKWATTKVSDCEMVGLRATMKKSQEGSQDRHCKGVSKADVLSCGTGNKRVSGPASQECQQDRRAFMRPWEHGGLRTGARWPQP